ncbi:MAG: S1C family serine protease [Lentimonas sp.]
MRKLTTVSLLVIGMLGVASGFQNIELKSGAAVRGEVILERADVFFVDLGYKVIQIPQGAILSIQNVDGQNTESPVVAPSDSLYTVSTEQGDQPVKAWVEQLGEAVGLVQTPTGLGSGFLINEEGYIVTNDHVIAGEHKISVTIFRQGRRELEKITYDKVRIVATSSDLDLALLKIEAGEGAEPFTHVPLARVDQGLSEGQTVFAIGSPLGLDRTVSQGIISVANRVINGRLYLQTTTQINPGNSGGPLFNLKGEVVGVNNMKIAAVGAEGLGFSISSRVLKSFLDNRDAYAFDPRNPNAGFRYLAPPKIGDE